MDQLPPASFAPRPWRRIALLVPALIVAATLGCGSRRNATRPIYVNPPPTAAPCPTPSMSAPMTTEPTLTNPTTITEPMTNVPLLDKSTTPAATTPSRPSSSTPDEPPLDLTPAKGASTKTPPSLQGPTNPTSMNADGRRSASGRLRPTALRAQVRPLVNDPDDLFLPAKADRPWKYIVLHHSASASGGYDQIDHQHRESLGWEGCGYHFVIGNGTDSPDGQIEVARRWSEQKQGIHCRNGKNADVSEYGIGICLVGDLDQSPPTPKQIAAARALVAYLSDRYHIPHAHLETHEHVASASAPTACPGKHFPMQAILGANKVAR